MTSTTAKVKFAEGSIVNEFDCGPFNGHVDRHEAQKERWDSIHGEMRPARPAHWSVTVVGINGGWCEVRMPLKPGRTMRKAVEIACAQFQSPSDIAPTPQGWFGSFKNIEGLKWE